MRSTTIRESETAGARLRAHVGLREPLPAYASELLLDMMMRDVMLHRIASERFIPAARIVVENPER
jgi:hypothetical protein